MIGFACFHEWIVYSLLAYTIAVVVYDAWEGYPSIRSTLAIILLLVQDAGINGRFGLALLYIIPMICIAPWLKDFLLQAAFLPFFLVIFGLFVDIMIIKILILGQSYSVGMTILKIFITLGIESLILLGMRGNRSLLKSRGRKVWTPNRKDAL